MKLFLSWSGSTSHGLAVILKDWFSYVLPGIEIFLSSEDIDFGSRWATELAQELDSSDFGIICITPTNIESPWMNYECGALSKRFSTSRVIPYLYEVPVELLKNGPFGQFQSVSVDREGTYKLLKTVSDHNSQPRPEDVLRKVFNKWWPDMEEQLEKLKSSDRQRAITSDTNLNTISPILPLYKEVGIIEKYADLDIGSLIKNAKSRADCFVVSGRHMFNSPQVSTIILDKIQNPDNNCKLRILAMDSMGDETYVESRNRMMKMGSIGHRYDHDLTHAREIARVLAQKDPEHKVFDMRFYNLMPTTFFYLIDNYLFFSHLLCKPVSMCPVTIIDIDKNPNLAWVFETHFEHYWGSSRYYVSIIGFNKEVSRFVMVHNRKRRGWEWPGGFIEPAENPKDSAIREFNEETGLGIENVFEVERTPFGIYYAGMVTTEIASASAREVAAVKWLSKIPQPRHLSFSDEYDMFCDIYKEAVNILKKQEI